MAQGLRAHCHLPPVHPQTQESCQTVLCGGAEVRDLILVSPPLRPGSEGAEASSWQAAQGEALPGLTLLGLQPALPRLLC